MSDRPVMHALSAEQMGELWDKMTQRNAHCYQRSVDTTEHDQLYRCFYGGRAQGLDDAIFYLEKTILAAQSAEDDTRIAGWPEAASGEEQADG